MTATGKGLIYGFGGLCLLVSKGYMEREGIHKMEYPIIVVMCAMGLGLVMSANDLMALYLALELQSLGMYVLAAIKRESAYSTEAGLKYFIVLEPAIAKMLEGGLGMLLAQSQFDRIVNLSGTKKKTSPKHETIAGYNMTRSRSICIRDVVVWKFIDIWKNGDDEHRRYK
jgi:NADH:ubiquinone oxidoreductase subunit 2 (subunit N)